MSNELMHYGVLGMRWGVRRYQNKDGALTTAGKKRLSKDKDKAEKKERKVALKNRRSLSDVDLKKKIERLKIEKEFKNLAEEDISHGRKYVGEIMSSAGKKALTVAAAGAMAYGVKVAMTKEFNIKEAAGYIAANPNKKK